MATWFTIYMTTKTAPKATYTLSYNKEWSLWIIFRNHENVACATTRREAESLIRYFREGGR